MTTFSMSKLDNTMRSEFITVLMDFLRQNISIEDLQKWLLGNLQIILDSGDPVMIDAANALDANLMELGEHVIEQDELIHNVDVYIRKLETIATKMELGEHVIEQDELIHNAYVYIRKLETIATKMEREEGLIVETGHSRYETIERQVQVCLISTMSVCTSSSSLRHINNS